MRGTDFLQQKNLQQLHAIKFHLLRLGTRTHTEREGEKL